MKRRKHLHHSPEPDQVSPFPSLRFSLVLEVLARGIGLEKEIKEKGKERLKLSLFAQNMIPYMGEPKDSTESVMELKKK